MTCVLMGGLWAVWVNRFANAGEAAVEAAGNTMEKVQLFFFPTCAGVLCSSVGEARVLFFSRGLLYDWSWV